LYIDSDWKEEAAREKEVLAEQERREKAEAKAAGTGGATPAFMELINTLAMQAAIALGGLKGPGGEQIPPNPVAAKHAIGLLEVLEQKTKGNLNEDEQRVLASVLYELRMQYVQAASAPPAPTDQGKSPG
jgi:hypothetical protein